MQGGCWRPHFFHSSGEVPYGSVRVFIAILQQVLRFMVPMGVIWHAWCLYFGVLKDPGTILRRSWDSGGHREGPCEVQAWILLIFWWFWGPILGAFLVLLDKRNSFFHIYFQVAFSDDFRVWDRVSGNAKTSIWHGRYCKNQLSQRLDFLWFQVRFFMILGGLGSHFHGFCWPGGWLENWWFFGVPRRDPWVEGTYIEGARIPLSGGSRRPFIVSHDSFQQDFRHQVWNNRALRL